MTDYDPESPATQETIERAIRYALELDRDAADVLYRLLVTRLGRIAPPLLETLCDEARAVTS